MGGREPEAPAPVELPRPAWTSLADFRLEDLPEMEFLVEGLVPVGLSLLVAKPKMGKSFMALQLCLEVSGGSTLLGLPTKKGQALYVSLEDPKRRFGDRSEEFDDGTVVPENVAFVTEAPKLDDGLLDILTEWLGTVKEPKLIVIDTLAKVLPSAPGRKSEYLHVNDVLDPLQRLAFDRNIAILVVHHAIKNEDSADVYDQIHGTTAISGVADALLFLSKARPADQARLDITGRDIEESALQLERRGTWWPVVGTPPPAALRLSPEKMEVLKAVQAGRHDTSGIAGTLAKTYKTANKHATELRDRGFLESSSTCLYRLTELGKSVVGEPSGSHLPTPTTASTDQDTAPLETNDPALPSEASLGNVSDPPVGETQVSTPLF